jgi:transposase IS116/IS110/IS902 family protein
VNAGHLLRRDDHHPLGNICARPRLDWLLGRRALPPPGIRPPRLPLITSWAIPFDEITHLELYVGPWNEGSSQAADAPGYHLNPDPDPTTGGGNAIRVTVGECVLSTVDRFDEIPGIGAHTAQAILAEAGLDMSRFPIPEHLVSWAKLCPHRHPKTGA